jgi:HEAT repeat protein
MHSRGESKHSRKTWFAFITLALFAVSSVSVIAYFVNLHRARGAKEAYAWHSLNVGELIRLSRNKDVDLRLKAVCELRHRKSRDATTALIERAMEDGAEVVRIMALQALVGRRDEGVDEVMLAALRRGGIEAKLASIHLSKSRNESTWHKLVQVYLSGASPTAEGYALRLLANPNESSIRPICSALGVGVPFKEDASPQLREKQRKLLEFINSVPHPALIPLLKERDMCIVAGALQLLIKFPCKEASKELLRLARSRHKVIRTLAISALSLAPSREVAGELKRMAKSGRDDFVRACATVALSQLGDVEFESVSNLLNSPDPETRTMALKAIENMNLPCDVLMPLLRKAMEDEDMDVRLRASVQLLRCGDKGLKLYIGALNKAHGDEKASMLLALRGIKRRDVLKVLVENLQSQEPQVRWAAQVAVASFGVDALPLLKGLLKHQDEKMRIGALNALMQIGGEEAVEAIAETAMKDSCTEVKISAIEALATLPTKKSLSTLRKLLHSDDDEVAQRAAIALGRLGREGFDALKEALNSKRTSVQAIAARALAFYGDLEAVRILRKIASTSSDEYLRLVSLQALARGGDEWASWTLIRMLSTNDEKQRMKVRAAILGLRERMLMPLVASLRDDDATIRAEAVTLLGLMRAESARDEISKLLNDSNPAVRQAAKSALQMIDTPRMHQP